MRIGIDIRSLQNDSQLRGIGTYTRCLVQSLLSVDGENEYVFFAFRNWPLPDLFKEAAGKKAKVSRLTWRKKRFVWLSGQVLFPYAAKKERLDIFYSPEYIVPVLGGVKKVITVHDFINREYDFYRQKSVWLRKAYLRVKDFTLAYADRIIAVSEYTKSRIKEITGIKDERIKVIYEAAEADYAPKSDEKLFSALRKKYKVDKEFLLYVGAIDHHKNIEGLLRAFSRIKTKDAALVMIGVKNDPGYFDSIINLIERLGLKHRVYVLGYIPQEDLAGFYNMAKGVVCLSFCEGFGLPVLEAMACARPVIASGNTSMAEIVGDCGILINPYNLEEITAAMDKVLGDESFRNSLAEKGFIRSKEFSWEKAARQMMGVWRELEAVH